MNGKQKPMIPVDHVTDDIFEWLMDTVPTSSQFSYKSRFISIRGKIVLIPEPEFMALAHVLGVMFERIQFAACVLTPSDMSAIEEDIRDRIGGTWSSHWSPSASVRKLAKRGVLTFERHTVPGCKNVFEYIVTLNGPVSISEHGILCIGG